MQPLVALGAVVLLIALSTVIGVVLRCRGGRIRNVPVADTVPLDPRLFGLSELGQAGTVVQFSTEFCARCPGVRRVLIEAVADQPGVTFAHVDLTHDPELAKQFRVLQTPTVLLIGSDGIAHTRLSGQISRESLATALHTL